MKVKICNNCLIEKPIKLFVKKRNGVFVYIERCRPCRAVARPFQRFWKKLSPENREKNRMANRARKLGCSVVIPFTKREIILRDGLNCYICKEVLTEKSATIDHVIALTNGGFHCPSNARIACLKCNQRKSNKS